VVKQENSKSSIKLQQQQQQKYLHLYEQAPCNLHCIFQL
jgi:hypothetical protein